MNNVLFELEDLVSKEVSNVVAAGCIKPEEWKNLYYAADIMKDIATIESMQNFDVQSSNYNPNYNNSMNNGMGNSNGRYSMMNNAYANNSYTSDRVDSRGSRDSYGNNRSMGNSNEHAIHMLEEKLNTTNDPAMREHLMKTIEMMKYER